MAFQMFRRGRTPTTMVDGDTLDLTDGHQVIVDLDGPDAPGAAAFQPWGYASFPDPRFEAPGTSFDGDRVGARSDDAERISAWADRMRQKRERDQAAILGDAAPGASSAGYWASEHVTAGDDTTADPSPGDPSRRARLLGELGLAPNATSDDIAGTYRRLAKQHHPDRWAEADEATRQLNAEEMMRVNAVYRALRISGDVGPRGRASTPPAPPAPGRP